jgi:hypothetical protein
LKPAAQFGTHDGAPLPLNGISISRKDDAVLADGALLKLGRQGCVLRPIDEWVGRRSEVPRPIVGGTDVLMRPSEFSDYLDDLLRVARPIAECTVATVRLDWPEIWAKATRPCVVEVLDRLRCGVLPIWVGSERQGLGRFYVGCDVVRYLEHRTPRHRAVTSYVQPSLPLWERPVVSEECR